MGFAWSDQHDKELMDGLKEGRSANEIGINLNRKFDLTLTRNAVLGRIFRLGLSVMAPPKVRPPRPIPKRRKPPIDFVRHAETMRDMHDAGFTWESIGKVVGCSGLYARHKAIDMGIHVPKPWNPINQADTDYIIKAWKDHVPVEDIADAIGRSFGVVRQKILKLQREKVIVTRDPSKTRLLRQYGEKALLAGATPSQALAAMAKAKTDAMLSARRAAKAAKTKRHEIALNIMRTNIAKGMDRKKAIFLARAEGVTLEMLAMEFGITRERIRQICMSYAENVALLSLIEGSNDDKQGEV